MNLRTQVRVPEGHDRHLPEPCDVCMGFIRVAVGAVMQDRLDLDAPRRDRLAELLTRNAVESITEYLKAQGVAA